MVNINPSQNKYIWALEWQKNNLVPLLKKPNAWKKVEKFWREQRFLDEVELLIDLQKTTQILDVGCGITTVLRFLEGNRIGIDPLAESYNKLIPYPDNISFYQGIGESLAFDTNQFDVVFCTNCIDHVTDPDKVIDEIRRVLGVNNHLILTCEIYPEDIGFRNDGHPFTFTEEKLNSLLRGWEIKKIWSTPWRGIYRYLINEPPVDRKEYVYLCCNVK